MENIKTILSRSSCGLTIALFSTVSLILQYGKYCTGSCQAAGVSPISVESRSFKNNSYIPSRFTADGANFSPALQWSKGGPATKSYCLICNDPDAPNGNWVHWVAYDIPSTIETLTENASVTAHNFRQGVNSFSKVGWNGPAPPAGKVHRYVFTVFALDTLLGNIGQPTDSDLKNRIVGHVLSSGMIVGLYRR